MILASGVEDKLKDFDQKPAMAKVMTLGMAERMAEEIGCQKHILKEAGAKDANFVGRIDEIVIAKHYRKAYQDNPYFAIWHNGNGWERSLNIWPTAQLAILDGIGCINEGYNSRFAAYAAKMVGLMT